MIEGMESGQQSSQESEITQAPAPESQPASQPVPGQPDAGVPAEGAVPATFTPNYKFKVLDKEHEIPEWMRSAIKDSESEKKIKELHEKAFGLDVVKPRLQSVQQENKTLAQQVKSYESGVQELRGHYAKGDFDKFFQKLAIPEEKVLQWVMDKINYSELPPEQQKAVADQKRAQEQAEMLQQQNQSLEQKYFEQASQAKGLELKMASSTPEVQSFAESFDAKAGKAGAFMDAVIDHGERVYFTRKDAKGQPVDLSPEQAIQEVMQHYGKFVSTQQQAGTPQAQGQQAGQQAPAQARKEPPVIPNVGGGQTSPMKSGPKSIQDLKKIYNNMS